MSGQAQGCGKPARGWDAAPGPDRPRAARTAFASRIIRGACRSRGGSSRQRSRQRVRCSGAAGRAVARSPAAAVRGSPRAQRHALRGGAGSGRVGPDGAESGCVTRRAVPGRFTAVRARSRGGVVVCPLCGDRAATRASAPARWSPACARRCHRRWHPHPRPGRPVGAGAPRVREGPWWCRGGLCAVSAAPGRHGPGMLCASVVRLPGRIARLSVPAAAVVQQRPDTSGCRLLCLSAGRTVQGKRINYLSLAGFPSFLCSAHHVPADLVLRSFLMPAACGGRRHAHWHGGVRRPGERCGGLGRGVRQGSHQPSVAPALPKVLALVKSSKALANWEVTLGTARITARYGDWSRHDRSLSRVRLVEALLALRISQTSRSGPCRSA